MSPPKTNQVKPELLLRRLRTQLPVDRIEIHENSSPCAVLRPETGGELSFITKVCREQEIPLRFDGTPAPKKKVFAQLDFSRLSRIQDLDEPSRLLLVQSGVTAGALEKWLNVHQWSLGWYSPSVQDLSLSRILQLGAPAFSRRFCGAPMDSVRGYRSILPDGSESWSPPGPLRATGPELLSLYEGGFGFGALTQLWILVHPYPRQETVWTLRANKVELLIDIARTELRDSAPPRQALISRAPPSKKGARAPWYLLISWNQENPRGVTFENRLRFHKEMRRAALKRIHEAPPVRLAPEDNADYFRCPVPLDPTMAEALEASSRRWVLSLLNTHEACAWSMSPPDASKGGKNPVLDLIAQRKKQDQRRANKIKRAFLGAIDKHEHFANRP